MLYLESGEFLYLWKVILLLQRNTVSAPENTIPFIELGPVSPFSFDICPMGDAPKEEPHRHNFQELIWIREGEGRHVIDNVELKIKPRMFYLIAQGQVHFFIKGVGLKGTLIRFTDDFFFSEAKNVGWDYHETLFNLFTIHQSMKINPGEVMRFEEIMDTMLYEFNKKALGWTQLLRHLLSILLIQLERTRSKKQQSNNDLTALHKVHNNFINHLEQEYKTQHTVGYFAQKLCIAERQLSDIARKFSGKTAKRLILERLILEAKRYLKHTNVSSKEIAYILGFSDPSYFSKVFTQIVGQSPSSYRC